MVKRIHADKVFGDKSFDVENNVFIDGYQCGLVSMKMTSGAVC